MKAYIVARVEGSERRPLVKFNIYKTKKAAERVAQKLNSDSLASGWFVVMSADNWKQEEWSQ